MDIQINQPTLNVSNRLLVVLKKAITRQLINSDTSQITFNYRDASYSSECGGYHPVEIALHKAQGDDDWSLLYVTDFAYYGHLFAELCKELDFNFDSQTFSAACMQPTSLNNRSAQEMFNLWQDNFLSYLEYGAFDEIEVTAW